VVVEQLRPNTVGVFRANDDACFHACLHGGDKKAAFSEIYRVLRRGGRLQLKIDVSDRGFGHGFAVRHISELKPSTPTQNTVDFGECCLLVGAKIDDAIADNHVCPSIIDW